MSRRRQDRLGEEIREEVARMLASELKDPRLGFLTVTRVELTHDLRYARVFVGVLGTEEERRRNLDVLRRASGFVRGEVGRRLRMRFAPEIDFRYDRGLDAADQVGRLLEETSTDETAAPTPADFGDEPATDDEPGPDGESGGDDEPA